MKDGTRSAIATTKPTLLRIIAKHVEETTISGREVAQCLYDAAELVAVVQDSPEFKEAMEEHRRSL